MQICQESRLARHPDTLDTFRKRGYVVEFETCLDECTRCASCAFALVCGRMQFARTPAELAAKLP